jgi:PPOX class probable F420-dependent enzyme
MTIDFSSGLGARALERLETDELIWLTTVGRSGQPNPNPVWFLWRAGRVLVLNRPGSARLAALSVNPQAALHFETGRDGDDVVVLNALATIRPEGDPIDPADLGPYLEKYQAGLASIGYTPEHMLSEYSVPLELTITKIRGL